MSSSIARTFGIGTINARGIAMTMLVVLVIAGLFFIPEIIDFQKGGAVSNQQEFEVKGVVTKEQVQPSITVSENIDDSGPSLWSKITGYFTNASDKAKTQRAAIKSGRTDAPSNARRTGEVVVSWKTIRSPESVQAMRTAADGAAALVKNLSGRYPQSAQALFRYISGIRFVLSSADKTMTSNEAFRFLERLDVEVTDALLREKVSAADFNYWSKVNLGSVFARSAMLRDKALRQKPFDPNLSLVRVILRQHPDQRFRFDPKKKPQLYLIISVEGTDAKSFTIYQSGEPIYQRDKIAKANRKGQRLIKVRNLDPRGLMLFRVHDRGGQVYDKFYDFRSPEKRFFWDGKKLGRYILPYPSTDPRLDSLFAVGDGSTEKNSNITYFTTSVGQGFSSF